MRRCSSELIAILFAVLALFDENSVCTSSSLSTTTSNYDTSTQSSTENVRTAVSQVQPDVLVASDNQTETSSVSVAQIGVGNITIFAVNSDNSSNVTVADINVGHKKPFNFFHNKGAMLRAFYVAVGILVIVTIYTFVASRLKRRNTKRHKYGLLTKHTDVELTPLGQDEEEEEHTVFDAVQYKS